MCPAAPFASALPSSKERAKGRERGKGTLDNQQGPTIQHRELCSLSCGSVDGREVQGEVDTRACMAESLCHSSETITILLISYSLIQNKRFFKKRSRKRKEGSEWLEGGCGGEGLRAGDPVSGVHGSKAWAEMPMRYS